MLNFSPVLVNSISASYNKNGKFISFYGDIHPKYVGSVVKAMASAKKGSWDGKQWVMKNIQERTFTESKISSTAFPPRSKAFLAISNASYATPMATFTAATAIS